MKNNKKCVHAIEQIPFHSEDEFREQLLAKLDQEQQEHRLEREEEAGLWQDGRKKGGTVKRVVPVLAAALLLLCILGRAQLQSLWVTARVTYYMDKLDRYEDSGNQNGNVCDTDRSAAASLHIKEKTEGTKLREKVCEIGVDALPILERRVRDEKETASSRVRTANMMLDITGCENLENWTYTVEFLKNWTDMICHMEETLDQTLQSDTLPLSVQRERVEGYGVLAYPYLRKKLDAGDKVVDQILEKQMRHDLKKYSGAQLRRLSEYIEDVQNQNKK